MKQSKATSIPLFFFAFFEDVDGCSVTVCSLKRLLEVTRPSRALARSCDFLFVAVRCSGRDFIRAIASNLRTQLISSK